MMRDAEFVAAFEGLTLPPASFRHADHVRLAWIYLRAMPLPAAMARYAERLQAFAAHLGKAGLYHETITFAFLLLINERIADAPAGEDWDAFRARNPDLFAGLTATLGRFYSAERLASDRARHGFVMPDRLA